MINPEILYEDNHIIVAVKPFNILSQGDITGDEDMLTILKSYIKAKYNKPGNVYLGLAHRLDRPTKGIMVFARTSKAASRLTEQIKTRQFNKNYLLVVHGIPDEKEGVFEDYLKKEDNYSTVISDKDNGKFASLDYKVLRVNKEKDLSLISVKLNTGRHHQIRVQFASRNYPLYGDMRYGIDKNKQLCLIANKLEFTHPVTKELMSFSIDFSRDIDGFDNF